MMKKHFAGLGIAGLVVWASAAAAHDFLLLPQQFTTARAGSVPIQATVGSSFPTPENVVTTDRLERVRAVGPGNSLVGIVGRRSSPRHFRLLAHGRPLTNYPVDLVGTDGKRRHFSTDARGAVHLPANARGMMKLFAAKLEPPVGAGRFTPDLTSLTFGRP